MKYTVSIRGIRFTYYRQGRGVTLVLIPAFHSDSRRLMPIFSLLAKSFDVVMPELPGISDNLSLGKYKHTAGNYALFIADLLQKLRVRNYILAGLCYGASIIINLLKNNVPQPKAVFLFEAIYHAKYLHLDLPYNIIVPVLLALGKRGINREKFMNYVLHDKKFLNRYFRFKYRHEKNIDEIVANQIRLTDTMNTKAYLDLIDDIFTTDFSRVTGVQQIPAYLIYIQGDKLVLFDKNSRGMQSLFPRSEIISVKYDYHAPPGEMTEEAVSRLLEPVKPILRQYQN